jgi:hypothetical protein
MLFVFGCGVLAVLTAFLLPHISLNKTPNDKTGHPEDESTSTSVVAMP